MRLAMTETRGKFPLSRKKILKKTMVGSIVWIILFGVLAFFPGLVAFLEADALMIGTFVILLGALVFFIVLTYLYQCWYFAVYYYDLTPDYIIIRKGPITPREITIPYERVQDVYVDQDIFDRILGIYDVHLSSATVASGMQAHIDGVERAAADGLRAVLLETVSKKIGKKS